MNSWQNQLIAEYDYIFEDCYQIDPPSGWQTIVEQVCAYIHWHNKLHDSQIQIWKITEINGGLKFEVKQAGRGSSITIEEIYGAIHLAEALSTKYCCECGQPGEFRKIKVNDGLIYKTLCSDHFMEFEDAVYQQEYKD